MKAKVKAAVAEIEGEFEGEVRADSLTLTETARAKGTFLAKRLNVREGAVLEGAINPVVAPAPRLRRPRLRPRRRRPGSAAVGRRRCRRHDPGSDSGRRPTTKPEDGGKTP